MYSKTPFQKASFEICSGHISEICGIICNFTEVITFFSLMPLYRETLMPALMPPSHPKSKAKKKKKSHQCFHFHALTLCHTCDTEFLEWVSLTTSPSPDLNANSTFMASHWLDAELKEIKIRHKVLLKFPSVLVGISGLSLLQGIKAMTNVPLSVVSAQTRETLGYEGRNP